MSSHFDPVLGYSKAWLEFISFMKPPITSCYVIETNELAKQILFCTNKQFTGRWDIEASEDKTWCLYFSHGLICGGSGIHPIRSWYRQLFKHCPELVKDDNEQNFNQTQNWNYDTLVERVKQRKISHDQMKVVIEGYIMEILFDIIQLLEQRGYPSGLRLSYSEIPQDTMNSAPMGIPAEDAWQEAMRFWSTWCEAGLMDISPNQALKILQAEELERHTSPLIYQNLVTLADGHHTLRDLATKSSRNLLLLTKPILPYLHKGFMELVEVKNLNLSELSPVTVNTSEQDTEHVADGKTENTEIKASNSPLVACIDDSEIDIMIMNQILIQAGYRFINIQEQDKTLLRLLAEKPDLIFLDLMMPIANGYEICAQIRRVPFFKTTPVIIVTGKDGMVDRARAKMVGASGFITKPIHQDKVLKTLQTYLSSPTSKPSAEKSKPDDSVPIKSDSILDHLKAFDGTQLIKDVLNTPIKQEYS